MRGVSDLEKLVLLGLHTQPTSAAVEIDALVDVVAWAEEVDKDPLSDIVTLNINRDRSATLKCLSLAILMLAGATSPERRQPRAGSSDKEKKGQEHLK